MTGLAQTTVLNQIELKADSTGNIIAIFVQNSVTVTLNGTQLGTPSYQRSNYAVDDPAVVAIIGQAASTMAISLNTAQQNLIASQAQVAALNSQINSLQSKLSKQTGSPS